MLPPISGTTLRTLILMGHLGSLFQNVFLHVTIVQVRSPELGVRVIIYDTKMSIFGMIKVSIRERK